MTFIRQPGDGLPDNLPLLTQVADGDESNDLPTLTECIPEKKADPASIFQPGDEEDTLIPKEAMPAPCALNEDEMQRLLWHIEKYIENIFTYQLNINLEQMQRTAIQHAVNDFKAELPDLLREALNRRPGL